MHDLGIKNELSGTNALVKLDIFGEPKEMPELKENESLLCGLVHVLGERMITCNDLKEMQVLFEAYATDDNLNVKWYTGVDVGYVLSL